MQQKKIVWMLYDCGKNSAAVCHPDVKESSCSILLTSVLDYPYHNWGVCGMNGGGQV